MESAFAFLYKPTASVRPHPSLYFSHLYIKGGAKVIGPRLEACIPGSHPLSSLLSKMHTFFQGTFLQILISYILGYLRIVENIIRNF